MIHHVKEKERYASARILRCGCVWIRQFIFAGVYKLSMRSIPLLLIVAALDYSQSQDISNPSFNNHPSTERYTLCPLDSERNIKQIRQLSGQKIMSWLRNFRRLWLSLFSVTRNRAILHPIPWAKRYRFDIWHRTGVGCANSQSYAPQWVQRFSECLSVCKGKSGKSTFCLTF